MLFHFLSVWLNSAFDNVLFLCYRGPVFNPRLWPKHFLLLLFFTFWHMFIIRIKHSCFFHCVWNIHGVVQVIKGQNIHEAVLIRLNFLKRYFTRNGRACLSCEVFIKTYKIIVVVNGILLMLCIFVHTTAFLMANKK